MERNFFRRIELAFPVLDRKLKRRVISEGLQAYLTDNVQAWEMKANGSYLRKRRTGKTPARCAQCQLIEALKPGAVPEPVQGSSAAVSRRRVLRVDQAHPGYLFAPCKAPRSGAPDADDAGNLMYLAERAIQLLQVRTLHGEGHVRLLLFRLRIDGDDVDPFAGEDIRNVAQQTLAIVRIDHDVDWEGAAESDRPTPVSMTRSGCRAARCTKFGQSTRWMETPLAARHETVDFIGRRRLAATRELCQQLVDADDQDAAIGVGGVRRRGSKTGGASPAGASSLPRTATWNCRIESSLRPAAMNRSSAFGKPRRCASSSMLIPVCPRRCSSLVTTVRPSARVSSSARLAEPGTHLRRARCVIR